MDDRRRAKEKAAWVFLRWPRSHKISLALFYSRRRRFFPQSLTLYLATKFSPLSFAAASKEGQFGLRRIGWIDASSSISNKSYSDRLDYVDLPFRLVGGELRAFVSFIELGPERLRTLM